MSRFDEMTGELEARAVTECVVSENEELDVIEGLRLNDIVGSESLGRFEFCSRARGGAFSESRRSGWDE